MKGEICSDCGYHLTFGEAAEILGRQKDENEKVLGINKFLNRTKVKCPNCGATGHWVSEDEMAIVKK